MSLSIEAIVGKVNGITDWDGRHRVATHAHPTYEPNNIRGREGHVTDVGAFREFLGNKDGVLAVIDFLRLVYSSYGPLNIDQFSDLSRALKELPGYLVLRKDSPVEKNGVPPPIIDAARAAAGVNALARNMEFDDDRDPDAPIDPKILFDTASSFGPDSENLFVNDVGTSCPAPEKVVLEVLDHMVYVKDPNAWRDKDLHEWGQYLSPDEIPRILRFGTANFIMRSLIKIKNFDHRFPATEQLIERLWRDINVSLGYAVEDSDQAPAISEAK